MKKIILAVAVVLAFAGCAATPLSLTARATSGGLTGIGTLAYVGTCEMDVAADMTAVTSLRHRAARDLTAGRIGVDTARQIQALADSARADLVAACPNRTAELDVAQRESARSTIKQIRVILEAKP